MTKVDNLFTYDPGTCKDTQTRTGVKTDGTNNMCAQATSQVACTAASGSDIKDACHFTASSQESTPDFWKDRHSVTDDGVVTVKTSVVRKLDDLLG